MADFWLVLASRRLRYRMRSGMSGAEDDDRSTWDDLMQAAGHT